MKITVTVHLFRFACGHVCAGRGQDVMPNSVGATGASFVYREVTNMRALAMLSLTFPPVRL